VLPRRERRGGSTPAFMGFQSRVSALSRGGGDWGGLSAVAAEDGHHPHQSPDLTTSLPSQHTFGLTGTTSFIGAQAGSPSCPTWCSSATAITGWSTRAAGRWSAPTLARCSRSRRRTCTSPGPGRRTGSRRDRRVPVRVRHRASEFGHPPSHWDVVVHGTALWVSPRHLRVT
jgi:hypothetical protein